MAAKTCSGENYATLLLDVLQNVFGDSILKILVSVTSDGASNMLGEHAGSCTRIVAAC